MRARQGLTRTAHLDPDLYSLELERIWRASWLFAAHTAELGHPGACAVFDVGDDSVILLRGEDAEMRAFHNFCRHRGSRLVDGPGNTSHLLRCPYHQWAYRLDGTLAACGGMDRMEGLDPTELGLLQVACREVNGLIFICLGTPGVATGTAAGEESDLPSSLGRAAGPQRLDRAKVAHSESYLVRAGWKVVWENNRECWHCPAGHPEYIKSNFDTANPELPEVRRRVAARTEQMVEALAEAGLASAEVFQSGGLAPFPSPGCMWSAHRTPLVEGFATESVDGAPLAPLMGDYPNYDVGVLRLRALPNFWCHASADHAVTTRLAPAAIDLTEVVVTWLVDAEAVEGHDYDLDKLITVWARTSEQDWALCERNQRGIRSHAYVPGPLSARYEANVAAFHDWYRSKISL